MKARSIRILMAAVTATLVFASCTANGGSIYATIENAKKTVTSTLAKTLTIQDLVARAPGGVHTYDVAAGAIFEGAISGTPSTSGDIIQWNTDASGNLLAIASPVPGQICSSLVFDGTNFWGAFFNPNSQTFGLYEAAGTSFSGQTPISASIIAGKQIMLLQVAGASPNIFAVSGAVTGSPYIFELDYYNSAPAGWAIAPLISGLTTMINGVAFDSVNNKYWVVAGTSVYRFSPGNPPLLDVGYPTSTLGSYNVGASSGQLNGVFIDPDPTLGRGTRIFIPSKLGGIYYSPDGGTTWGQYGPDNINNNTVGYLCVAGPVDAVSPGGNLYLVGADGWGYYYLNVSAGTFTRYNDSTTLLYSAAVRRILVDPAGNNSVFMGTAGGGLWRASFNSGAPDANGWIHE
ncbi:MAG: hypothetical protein ABSG63_14555 [Spirochaetia bacterium]|jgi:hypothetical protein